MSATSVQTIRDDFPILRQKTASGAPIVYLDNAASTQHPWSVLKKMESVYTDRYANVHRGIHFLSEHCTEAYEQARETLTDFLGAQFSSEVLFTSGTTMGANLVAHSWGDKNIKAGDEILISEMEHHSNSVPWFQLAKRKGAAVKVIPLDDKGDLNLNAYKEFLNEKTKLVAITAASNVLGSYNDLETIVLLAHRADAVVFIDAAQWAPHQPLNVQKLGIDFLAFSGHKMLGPTAIGILYGKQTHLEEMPPFLGGGSMVKTVTNRGFEVAKLPEKFEAGTPPIVEAIGLAAAAEYLRQVGWDFIHAHLQNLTTRAHNALLAIEGLDLLGPADPIGKNSVLSFTLENVHPHDLAQILDQQGIAIRAGHHCAMPLHQRFGITSSARASFYIYNTAEEVDQLATGIRKAASLLR
ncbi:MAG: SufS family cysteine desulfurase [Pirellulaceae bacterium]|nr:SufS family cysteine desulfurase [Pirellulaceae bacterium]